MKRSLLVFFAVFGLVATVPAAAHFGQGRMGQGQGMGPGGFGGQRGPDGRGGPGRQGGPGGPGGLMPLLQRLDLTDAQREQVRAIVEERRDDRPDGNMPELQQQLQAAIFADTPDVAKIEQLKTAIAAAEAGRLAARIDTELRLAQILTPEQRAKARELAARGPGRGGRRGRP
jgi:periplasmic protein CpxP/Spy